MSSKTGMFAYRVSIWQSPLLQRTSEQMELAFAQMIQTKMDFAV